MIQKRTRSRIALFGLPLAAVLAIGLGAYRVPAPSAESALTLSASLQTRTLVIRRGDSVIKEFPIAVGQDRHPTPRGRYTIRKIVWNPSWVPPKVPWARGKKPAAPGARQNPMKTVKIFFQEPDYYIHGTGAVESLGEAASHGCLRMDPNQAAEVALLLMDNAGTTKDWDWVRNVLGMGEQRVVSLATPAPLIIED